MRVRDSKHAEFHFSEREVEIGVEGGVIHAGELGGMCVRERRESGWDHPESDTHLTNKSKLSAGSVAH